MPEDYRAGLREDLEHERADPDAGRKVKCPLLVTWALQDDTVDLYDDLLGIWQGWATDVHEATIDCGHHMSEERPEELARLLRDFLAG